MHEESAVFHQVIYSSRARLPLDAEALEEILHDARAGNEARNVTGALVYADGVFLQVLEGELAALEPLIELIRQDSRHDDMKVFRTREVETRAFTDWRMAYHGSSSQEMARWAGLAGTVSIDELLQHVQHEPEAVPRILLHIVRALATAQERH
jgi:hypothetical protein